VTPAVRGNAPPPGIVDTLTAGFQAINRVPWVIGLPALLDLLLWLGPRLSVTALMQRGLTALSELVAGMGQSAGPGGAEQVSQFQQQIDLLRSQSELSNLAGLLIVGFGIAWNWLALRGAVPLDKSGLGGSLEVATGPAVLGIAIGLVLLGIALACVWLGFIAQQVRDGRVDVPRLGRAAPRYWLAIVAFFALLIALFIAIALPLSALAAVAQLAAPAVGAFLAVFVALGFQLLLFWCVLYLFFFGDAIVVSEVGPVRAALNSVRVVSTHFWSTLGFIIITWVIMSGMGVIWSSLSRAPVGIVVAIFGNGYIVSGLAAASMLFYRNRIARLVESGRTA
jgi:hypothetical protein